MYIPNEQRIVVLVFGSNFCFRISSEDKILNIGKS